MAQKRLIEKNIVNGKIRFHIPVPLAGMNQEQISRLNRIQLPLQHVKSFSVTDKHKLVKIVMAMFLHLPVVDRNQSPERKILPQEV